MIKITEEQERLVRSIFERGGFSTETDVVSSALELLQRQRKLLADVDAGVDALNAGEYTEYGESDRERFLADIAAEAKSRRHSSDA